MSAPAVTASGKATQRTISAADLARRLGRFEAFVDELLVESEAMGRCRDAAGGWRLSDDAGRRFGRALRGLTLA